MVRELFIQLHDSVLKSLPILAVFSFFSVLMFGLGFSDGKSYIYSFLILAVVFVVFKSNLINFDRSFPSVISQFITFIAKLDFKLVVLFGVCLRLVFWLLIDPKQVSDLATYVDLANKLILGESYSFASTNAYWPIGYPLTLSATHLFYFDVNNISILMLNIALYVASCSILYSLVTKVYDLKVASIAVFVFSIWPTNAMLVGYAVKEYIVLFALLTAVNFYFNEKFKYRNFFLGMCLGFSVLVQPSCILFFTVFVVTSWYRQVKFRSQIFQLISILFGMALVISPWTFRNYQVFDQFVMVSTNGGSNLYRANNELAHGGYLERTISEIEEKTEVERDAEYKKMAKEWIINNPVDFAVLSFRKMNLFMGDDSVGAYLSLKAGAAQPVTPLVYYLVKMVSNSYWVLLWVIFLIGWKVVSQDIKRNPKILAITLSFLYFFVIHAVFESNAKYHFVVMWVLALFSARVLCMPEPAIRNT